MTDGMNRTNICPAVRQIQVKKKKSKKKKSKIILYFHQTA